MRHNILCLISILNFAACHALNNQHDPMAIRCDINAKTKDHLLIQFTNPGGSNLSAEQIAQLQVQYLTSDRSESLEASSQACVMVPLGQGQLKAHIVGDTPLSAEMTLSESAVTGSIRSVELAAPGYLELGLKCPKNGLMAVDSLNNVIEIKKSIGNLSGYQVNLNVMTASGAKILEIFTKDSLLETLAIPESFRLDQLAEGTYRLNLLVFDSFHANVDASLQSQCGLTVKRSCAVNEVFDRDTVSCLPKLCDNTYRVGAIWSESLPLQRGTGRFECRVIDGNTQKTLLDHTCKGGFVKTENDCLGAKKIDGTCALLENDDVACWGTILRNDRQPWSPDAHDVNLQMRFRFPGKVTHFDHWCVGMESGQAYCWTYSNSGDPNPRYFLRTDANTPKTWDAVFPEGFSTYNYGCGITVDGLPSCGKDIHIPEKALDYTPGCAVGDKGHLYCSQRSQPSPLTLDESIAYDGYYLVKGLPESIRGIRRGGYSSCLLLANGRVLCSGNNADGSVGSNSSLLQVDELSYVVDSNGKALNDIIQLTNTNYSASTYCALERGGRVFCWGSNTAGELANGTPGRDQEGFNLFSRFAIPIIVEAKTVVAP